MKKFLSITLAIFILVVSLASCQSQNNENDCPEQTPVEAGFGGSSGCEPVEWTALYCAYRFDNCVLDSEEIKFTIYFGASLGQPRDNEAETPIYVRLRNDDGKEIILHEFTADEIFTEEYACNYDIDAKRKVFNHSEEIILTEEILTKDKGHIAVQIEHVYEEGRRNHGTSAAGFFYKIENGKVRVSTLAIY